MAHRDPAPVWFQTRVSRILILYLFAVHGLAAVALLEAALPGWLTALGGVLLVVSLGDGLRVHLWRRGRRAVKALHWQADGHWRVLDGCGSAARFSDQQVVLAHPMIILVRLAGPGGRRWLLLAADSADAEALRRLRVRLRRLPAPGETAQEGPLAGT